MNFSLTYRVLGLLGILLWSVNGWAQPANNACGTAQTITPDGTCYNGTTVGASDNWVGSVGCQGNGNNPDTWYTFVATGTVATFNVTATAISGDPAIGGNIEITLVLDLAPPCGALFIVGTYCGPSPVVNELVSTSTTPGETYYYTISSSGSTGSYSACVTNTSPPPSPGFDCTTSTALCNVAPFSQGTFTGIGATENIATNSCFGQNERQSKWYTFTCTATGTFELLINPTANTNDYDFALYDVTGGCYVSGSTMGVPIACNWSGCQGSTGIASTLPYFGQVAGTDYNASGGGPFGCNTSPQWNKTPPTLTACRTYALLIDNFTSNGGGFATDFGGTAVLGPQADFTYTITDDLPGDCRIVSVTRPATYCSSGAMSYFWNFGDGTTSTSASPPPHTYTDVGDYTVSFEVTDANGCVKTFSYTINVGCVPPLPIELLTFDAKALDDHVLLSWTTAVEVGNQQFSIERSIDGQHYSTVGDVPGAGFSSTHNSYSFRDTEPIYGTSYYRLRQIDYNGASETFDPVTVNYYQNFTAMNLLPNGNEGQYVLENHCNLPSRAILHIYDVLGNQMLQKPISLGSGKNRVELDLSDLPSGHYTVHLQNSNEIDAISFVKL